MKWIDRLATTTLGPNDASVRTSLAVAVNPKLENVSELRRHVAQLSDIAEKFATLVPRAFFLFSLLFFACLLGLLSAAVYYITILPVFQKTYTSEGRFALQTTKKKMGTRQGQDNIFI